jgi:protein phosphatase
MLRFSGSGVSDVGRRREHNEDAAYVAPYVALVADGVGGAAAGEVASATVAYVVAATALSRFGGHPLEVASHAVEAALDSLRDGVRRDDRRDGMATTLTGVLTDGQDVALIHVGDSRAFLLRDGELTQVSRDHTYVQVLIDDGELAEQERTRHPWRNVVMRSLHSGEDVPPESVLPDLTLLDVQPGDRLMLCSDGLTDLVDGARIRAVLGLSDPGSAAAVLVQQALVAGGVDNITCLVLDVVDGPLVVGHGRAFGALADLGNIVDPAAVHL